MGRSYGALNRTVTQYGDYFDQSLVMWLSVVSIDVKDFQPITTSINTPEQAEITTEEVTNHVIEQVKYGSLSIDCSAKASSANIASRVSPI